MLSLNIVEMSQPILSRSLFGAYLHQRPSLPPSLPPSQNRRIFKENAAKSRRRFAFTKRLWRFTPNSPPLTVTWPRCCSNRGVSTRRCSIIERRSASNPPLPTPTPTSATLSRKSAIRLPPSGATTKPSPSTPHSPMLTATWLLSIRYAGWEWIHGVISFSSQFSPILPLALFPPLCLPIIPCLRQYFLHLSPNYPMSYTSFPPLCLPIITCLAHHFFHFVSQLSHVLHIISST